MNIVRVKVTHDTDGSIRIRFNSMAGLTVGTFDTPGLNGLTSRLLTYIGSASEVSGISVQSDGATSKKAIVVVSWRGGSADAAKALGTRLMRDVGAVIGEVTLEEAFWLVTPPRRRVS